MDDTPPAEALLPCPFCGGAVKSSWSFGSVYVECRSCGAARSCSEGETGDDVERNAAARWNTRAAQPVSVAPDDEALIDAFFDEAKHKGDYGPARLALRRHIAGLRHIEWLMNYGGIIEVSVRNPNVKSYMEVWEKRAENAEAALAACRDKTIEECAAIATARRNQWSCAGGFGGHSAGARIIQDEILALKKEPTNG